MAKRGRSRRPHAKWHLGGKKVSLSRKRGHKPVELLRLYHSRMEKNLGKLENIIRRREAAGE